MGGADGIADRRADRLECASGPANCGVACRIKRPALAPAGQVDLRALPIRPPSLMSWGGRGLEPVVLPGGPRLQRGFARWHQGTIGQVLDGIGVWRVDLTLARFVAVLALPAWSAAGADEESVPGVDCVDRPDQVRELVGIELAGCFLPDIVGDVAIGDDGRRVGKDECRSFACAEERGLPPCGQPEQPLWLFAGARPLPAVQVDAIGTLVDQGGTQLDQDLELLVQLDRPLEGEPRVPGLMRLGLQIEPLRDFRLCGHARVMRGVWASQTTYPKS
jgi:hypothetical protein